MQHSVVGSCLTRMREHIISRKENFSSSPSIYPELLRHRIVIIINLIAAQKHSRTLPLIYTQYSLYASIQIQHRQTSTSTQCCATSSQSFGGSYPMCTYRVECRYTNSIEVGYGNIKRDQYVKRTVHALYTCVKQVDIICPTTTRNTCNNTSNSVQRTYT